MSGSGLVQFIVNMIALLAAGGIFFLAIDKVAPDEFFAKVAKIAIGAMLLIALAIRIESPGPAGQLLGNRAHHGRAIRGPLHDHGP